MTHYALLPFQLGRFDDGSYLIVNESGEYHFLDRSTLEHLVNGILAQTDPHYPELASKQFLADGDLTTAIDMTATRYRTKKRFISEFTALHMLVITLRCNQDCRYCQVSAESDIAHQFDMSPEAAKRAVDFAFMSPSPAIKIEFQGGEPTLNWKALTAAVAHAEATNLEKKKNLEFVICTNLTSITREKLEYLRDHNISISTSLDGPQHIHDKNRISRTGGDGTYQIFENRLQEAFDVCSRDSISALMTTTAGSVDHLREVVDEYVAKGFTGIFFRALNPYGLAAENCGSLGYTMERFAENYENALDYIIELNLRGTFFVEFFASILLSRILTPFSTGFVDLQSPAGTGISGVIYDFNGDVYPADEARMLARMGDKRFLMGNVFTDSYTDIFGGPVIRELVAKSIVEGMPGCASCVYRTYCGADPVRNYLETGDLIGRRPDGFCEKNKRILDILFKKLKADDPDTLDVFWSWITNRPLSILRSGAT